MTRVLLIDDDPSIQEVYSRLLRDEGFQVSQATNADKATELLITKPFDLILLDIHMPRVDGSVMREVIECYDENLKIIVSSVYPLSEQQKRVPKAAEYFDKSHGTELLMEIIRRVMKNEAEDPSNEKKVKR